MGSVDYELGVGAPPNTTLRRVTLGLDWSPACKAGLDARRISVDGEDVEHAASIPVGGTHRVVAIFRDDRDMPTNFEYLDLSFDTPFGASCERIAIQGPPDPEWRAIERGEFGIVTGVEAPIESVGNTVALFPAALALGERLGRIRLAAYFGIGGLGVCNTCIGPAIAVPLGAGVTWYPFEGDRFGLELRIREYATWGSTGPESHLTLLHAPAGVVHLGLAPKNQRNGAALGPRVTAVDLELPVGVLAAHEDTGTHLEPYFGVGVSVWWWR